jgi:hypothetical protein
LRLSIHDEVEACRDAANDLLRVLSNRIYGEERLIGLR